MSYKVVVTDYGFPNLEPERSILEPLGAEVIGRQCKTPEEVIENAADADFLMVTWAPITKEVIQSLRRCRGIVRYGVGYDMIDVQAAQQAGIPVANVPHYCTEEVADHTLKLLLALVRKLPKAIETLRQGEWGVRSIRPVPPLNRLRLGLAGFGRIARAVAARAKAFGFPLQAYDPYVPDDVFVDSGVERVDFPRLLATSDVLSLHLPLSEETRHLLNRETVRAMKRGAFLINVSRGGLIEEAALLEAVRSGHLSGAALDVFEAEPLPIDAPLRKLDQVILTSHIAWYSEASFKKLQQFAAEEVARALRGEPFLHRVN